MDVLTLCLAVYGRFISPSSPLGSPPLSLSLKLSPLGALLLSFCPLSLVRWVGLISICFASKNLHFWIISSLGATVWDQDPFLSVPILVGVIVDGTIVLKRIVIV